MRSISALAQDMHVSSAQSVCVGLSTGISALPGPWPKGARTEVKNTLSVLCSHSIMKLPFLVLRDLRLHKLVARYLNEPVMLVEFGAGPSQSFIEFVH